MYLTRIELDLRDRSARLALEDPYYLHQTLMRAFDHAPAESRRVLFRIEPAGTNLQATVIVQSDVQPDWSPDLCRSLGPQSHLQSKPWAPGLGCGQELSFRLRANPTVKRAGKRHGLFRETDQLEWLRRKLRDGGAELLAADVQPEGAVVSRKSSGSGAGERGPQRMTFSSVLFEGRLRVDSPELFVETLAAGIGSAKGLGFGLLSLAPARTLR